MSTTATDEAILAAAGRVTDPVRPLPFAFAKRHGVLVRGIADDSADVVVRDGASPLALAEVRRHLRRPLKLERVNVERFDLLLREAYEAGSGTTMDAMGGLEEETDLANLAQDIPEQSDLLESEDEAPIIRLINALLTQAVKENASDIHIEPFENRLVVRFRVDGVLREVLQTKRAVAPLIVSRIKVMSRLDIAEKRLPQDGRISLRIAGRAVDVRVSTIPAGPRRARGAAPARQAGRPARPQLARHGPGHAGPHRRADPQAERHPAGHRPDRLGQDHHAVRGARPHQRPHAQHHDGRGPDRVLHRRHRPDAGQHQGRDDLRARPARHPAPGPGRGDGRRNPRPRDRADRGAVVADRPPGAVDAAHQHRRRRRHAPARHGHRAVPAGLDPGRRAGAAPGARAEPGDPRGLYRRRVRAPPAQPAGRRALAHAVPPEPARPERRLPRPHRHLRTA